MQNAPPTDAAAWNNPTAHPRPAPGPGPDDRQYAYQYSPDMNYYPNQNLPSHRRALIQPTTPPASAPVATHSPVAQYYTHQPTSAPPHPNGLAPYPYYPPYPVDYNEYPRQPSGSALQPQHDPNYGTYRPQLYYPQQQLYQWHGYGYASSSAQPQPLQPLPPPASTNKRSADADPVEEKKRKKGRKAERDEPSMPKPPSKSHLNPPRQAQSAWQLFFADELVRAKAAAATSPGGTPAKLNVAQVAKDAGTAYGNLDPERRDYYTKMVQESKEAYARELVAWQATLTPEDIRLENAFRAQQRKDGKSRKGNLKDPNAPKKPLSAYFLFLKSIREDSELRAKIWGSETETTKQSVLAAEKWRGLSDEEKKPYLLRAGTDKVYYDEAKKNYEQDSAARARGEQVPDRPNLGAQDNVEAPASLIKSAMFETTPPFGLAGFEDVTETQEWDDIGQLIEAKEETL